MAASARTPKTEAKPIAKPANGGVRKLRKACSLPTCSQQTGTCMHCTCDGRCGRHVAGRCGGRREGSGRGCKREGCSRDDRCFHSNRATCCHCRNLVSSTGRAAKRPRVAAPQAQMQPQMQSQMQPQPLTATLPNYSNFGITPQPTTTPATSTNALEDELRDFLCDANLGGDLALCEYPQWASRRWLCNLVVVVCGVQFNLHKHPMLLESRLLHRYARAAMAGCVQGVPVVTLPSFPGGADMFETLAIYAYTGELSFSMANFAVMHCAIEFLEMRDDVRTSARRFLQQQLSDTQRVSVESGDVGLNGAMQVVAAANTLAQAQPDLFRVGCKSLIEMCLDAVAGRGAALGVNAMMQVLTLPNALFVEITESLVAGRGASACPEAWGNSSDAKAVGELCVLAQLAQLHREAQRSPDHCPSHHLLARKCVQLLRESHAAEPKAFKDKSEGVDISVASPQSLRVEAELMDVNCSDKVFLSMMEMELDLSSGASGSPAGVESPTGVQSKGSSGCLGGGSHLFDALLQETFVV